jgi:transposase-like protein
LCQLATMGRPRLADDPEHRARMVAAATDWKVIRAPLDRVAFYYGVHPNTVKNWTRRALRLKGADGDRLRALVSLAPDLHDGDPGGDDAPDD